MFIAEPFNACKKCPSPISCDIRSACDLAPKERTAEDMLAEITGLRVRQQQLQDELANANGALIASREEARQMRIAVDRLADKSIPAVNLLIDDLDVTEEEEQAFAALALRVDRLENAFTLQQGRINTIGDRLDAAKAAL